MLKLGRGEDALTISRKLGRSWLKKGRAAEWEALAGEIREGHRRKAGFLSAFERLSVGRRAREPSLIDRARKRWAKGAGRGRP